MAVIYFILSAAMLVFAVNATRPPWTDKPTALRPAWLPVMLTNELAPLLLAAMIALNAIAALLDVFRQPLGVLGFVASVGSMALLGWMVALGICTGRTMGVLLPSTSTHQGRRVEWLLALWPQPYRIPAGVEVSEDHEYMQGQHLDLYRSDSKSSTESPVLVHVHGGSWSGGNRKQQARPLIHAMALRGWVVAAVDYPLVPVATFPDPIVAVHNAIGWIRSHAADLGVDPAQIYVTGGSSGAHLASLAALTDMNSEWTTRNEIDPPVAGAVVFYGVFDLLNRSEIRDDWPIIPEGLIKADPKVDPQKFEVASPIDWVHRDAPPFVIVHGRQDSLVPCAESSLFASALAEVSRNPVDLVLLRGASHSFDSVPSVRTQQVVAAVGDRLDDLVRRSSADDLQ